jgi:hypothetical protein
MLKILGGIICLAVAVQGSARDPTCDRINNLPLDFNQTVINILKEPGVPVLVSIEPDMMRGELYIMEVTTSRIHDQRVGINKRLNGYPYLLKEEYSWVDLSYYHRKNPVTGDISFDEPYNKIRITDNYIFEATDYLRSTHSLDRGQYVMPPRVERRHFAAILDTYYVNYNVNDVDPIIVDLYHIDISRRTNENFYAVIINIGGDYVVSSLSPVRERAIQAHSMKEWGVAC